MDLITLALVVFAPFSVTSTAQAPSAGPALPRYGFDTAAIRWVMPGDFATALARAKAERRLLLIKGVAFGIDTAGAQCATKGKW